MTTRTVYRVQPIGKELGDHRSRTSNDELDRGCHVFGSYEELLHGVNQWCRATWRPEVVEIECDSSDLADNGDYEGFVLVSNRGRIVARTAYKSWTTFADFVRETLRGE